MLVETGQIWREKDGRKLHLVIAEDCRPLMRCCDVVFSRNRVEEKKYISDILHEYELVETYPPRPGKLPFAAIARMGELAEEADNVD